MESLLFTKKIAQAGFLGFGLLYVFAQKAHPQNVGTQAPTTSLQRVQNLSTCQGPNCNDALPSAIATEINQSVAQCFDHAGADAQTQFETCVVRARANEAQNFQTSLDVLFRRMHPLARARLARADHPGGDCPAPGTSPASNSYASFSIYTNCVLNSAAAVQAAHPGARSDLDAMAQARASVLAARARQLVLSEICGQMAATLHQSGRCPPSGYNLNLSETENPFVPSASLAGAEVDSGEAVVRARRTGVTQSLPSGASNGVAHCPGARFYSCLDASTDRRVPRIEAETGITQACLRTAECNALPESVNGMFNTASTQNIINTMHFSRVDMLQRRRETLRRDLLGKLLDQWASLAGQNGCRSSFFNEARAAMAGCEAPGAAAVTREHLDQARTSPTGVFNRTCQESPEGSNPTSNLVKKMSRLRILACAEQRLTHAAPTEARQLSRLDGRQGGFQRHYCQSVATETEMFIRGLSAPNARAATQRVRMELRCLVNQEATFDNPHFLGEQLTWEDIDGYFDTRSPEHALSTQSVTAVANSDYRTTVSSIRNLIHQACSNHDPASGSDPKGLSLASLEALAGRQSRSDFLARNTFLIDDPTNRARAYDQMLACTDRAVSSNAWAEAQSLCNGVAMMASLETFGGAAWTAALCVPLGMAALSHTQSGFEWRAGALSALAHAGSCAEAAELAQKLNVDSTARTLEIIGILVDTGMTLHQVAGLIREGATAAEATRALEEAAALRRSEAQQLGNSSLHAVEIGSEAHAAEETERLLERIFADHPSEGTALRSLISEGQTPELSRAINDLAAEIEEVRRRIPRAAQELESDFLESALACMRPSP